MTDYIKATNLNQGDEVYYKSGEHVKCEFMILYTVFNSENTLTTAKGADGKLVTLATDRLYIKKAKTTEFDYTVDNSGFGLMACIEAIAEYKKDRPDVMNKDYYIEIQGDYTKTL